MRLKYFWKPFVWLIIIAVLSLIPGNDLPNSKFFIPHFDKIVHVGMYFFICIFLISPFEKSRFGKGYVAALLVSLFIGALLEVLQSTVAVNRSGNIADFIADFIGALLALALYRYFISGKKINILFTA